MRCLLRPVKKLCRTVQPRCFLTKRGGWSTPMHLVSLVTGYELALFSTTSGLLLFESHARHRAAKRLVCIGYCVVNCLQDSTGLSHFQGSSALDGHHGLLYSNSLASMPRVRSPMAWSREFWYKSFVPSTSAASYVAPVTSEWYLFEAIAPTPQLAMHEDL